MSVDNVTVLSKAEVAENQSPIKPAPMLNVAIASTIPNTGKPSKFSTSSSFFTVLSKYSSKNARPTVKSHAPSSRKVRGQTIGS
jgi:hypothetical protein